MYRSERLKTRTTRTQDSLLLTDVFALQTQADALWYQVSADTLRKVIGGSSITTGLLSDRVWFEENTLNPNAPDIDIQLYAYMGNLRWIISGVIYQYDILSWFGIVIDEFDGATGESRIDTVYAKVPANLADHSTGIAVYKGTNAITPVAPGLSANEVLLGYIYINENGFGGSTGGDTNNYVVVDNSKDNVAGYQEITGKKYLNNRVLFKQAVDLASANNLVLGNGRFYRLTGTTELQTINNNGWTGGTDILIEIKNNTVVKHNAADYGLGNYNGILLACQNDFTATQDIILHLVYDSDDRKWKEVGGTTIAAIVDRPWYTALKVQAFCELVDATTYITIPDAYLGYTVTNAGTATFEIVENRIEFTSTGTAYMIQFWDGSTLIDTFPLSEAPRLVSDASFIEEMRSRYSSEGLRTGIVNSQGYTTQDEEFYTHFYGICRILTSEYIIDVPNLSDGNIQTFLL